MTDDNRVWIWWCDDCEKSTKHIQLEDGTYQCQSCGGTS